jgi:guanylate kinase
LREKKAKRKDNERQAYILSGPAGVGKGTVLRRVFEKLDNIAYSVSCTTRTPRPGERDGTDYVFYG